MSNSKLEGTDQASESAGAAAAKGAAEEKENEEDSTRSIELTTSHAATQIVQSLFGPSVGPCWGDVPCQHNRVSGRLYASSSAVLFYSNLFGFEKKIQLNWQDVYDMELYRNTSIQISLQDCQEVIFKGIDHREDVLEMLKKLQSRFSHDAIMNSPPPLERSGSAIRSDGARARGLSNQNNESIVQGLDLFTSTSSRQPSSKKKKRSRSLPPLRRDQKDEKDDDSADDASLETWEESKKPLDPPLKIVGIEPTVLPFSLDDFFNKFLANDAPYSVNEFQRKSIGDEDIKISLWKPAGNGIHSRTIDFKHPVNNVLGFGPSHAHTIREQQIKRFPGRGIYLRTSTSVAGLPSADCFTLEDQWLIEEVGNNQVTLSVRFDTRFTKMTFIKGIIQSSTRSETTKWFRRYAEMVKSAVGESSPPEEKSAPLPTNDDLVAILSTMNKSNGRRSMMFVTIVLPLLLFICYHLYMTTTLVAHLCTELNSFKLENERISAELETSHELLKMQSQKMNELRSFKEENERICAELENSNDLLRLQSEKMTETLNELIEKSNRLGMEVDLHN